LEVFIFYRDKPGRHPGQILVDWRSAGAHLGWLSEAQAWNVLQSVRRTHYCAQRDREAM
jgi:hypothetical protein